MHKAVIVSATRTAVGKHVGQWTNVLSDKLMAAVLKEAVARAGISPADVEDVVIGNIYGPHGNLARISALEAGFPIEVPATTVDRQCGSGTQAIVNAALNIMAGYGDIFVAGGVEHMTRNPYQMDKAPAYSYTPPAFLPVRLSTDAVGNISMPMTCEILGEKKGITRKECDEWAVISQQRAARAVQDGTFASQITPIEVRSRKETITVATDECVRGSTTMEALARLPSLVKENGLVTAGNACPRSDGAGAVVMMSEQKAKDLGIRPMASIRSFAAVGVDPNIMGYGPVPATRKALERGGLTLDDIGVIELNEAFAAQTIPCMRDLGLDPEKTNPNGGAIALGHPLGGTGAILTTKILYEMQAKGHQFGLVTMCIGGGQGMAVIYELC